jgi:autotransporter-associated beta strand protein
MNVYHYMKIGSIPAACCAAVLNAQSLRNESFDYPAGSLDGQSGGSGWLGAWAASPAATAPPLASPGLTYQNLTSSGVAVLDNSGSTYSGSRQWFDPAVPFANGAQVWFSCLLRYDVSHNSDILMLPFGNKGSSSGGVGVAVNSRPTANSTTWGNDPHIFIRNGTTNFGVAGSSSGAGLAGSVGLSKPIFVVGRITLSTSANSDSIDLWVNQTQAPSGNSSLRMTGLNVPRSTSNSDGKLIAFTGYSARGAIDEIKIGSTYTEVAGDLVQTAPPAIALVNPTQDQVFSAPATVNIAADVTANGHTVSKVQFLSSGTLLGEDTTAPYQFSWTNVPASSAKVSARVIYNGDLAITTAERSILILDNSPVTFSIDAASNRKAISPYIYGTNNISNTSQLEELNYTLNRRGGEVESRYDYQTNSKNIAKNWYFTSSNASGTPASEVGGYIKTSFDAQADVMVSVPTIGWMPKPGTHSFSQAKYGLQTENEPYGVPDAGNGKVVVDASGNPIPYNPATAAADRITHAGNTPVDLTPFHADPRFRSDRNDANYLPANPLAYQSGFIDTLISQWGSVANGGVRFYTLDNEPGLWDYIHRDIRGDADVTKEEIRDYIVSYGDMIKDRDPAAQILAPSEWGWAEADDYYPWLLAQLQANDTATGRRSLDILTVHYYPSFPGPIGTPEGIINLNQSTRSLWDPNWTDESWINTKINMIPTLRSWVANNYPGTKIGITEYNWSMTDYDNTIAGAVIQAEVLGIFGREGLDLATRWGSSANNPSNLIFKAMKMYRNYDNMKSTFGDTSVSSVSTANPDEINAFAAERSTDGALTLMVVNKQIAGTRTASFPIANFTHNGTAQVFRLDVGNAITRLGDMTLTGNTLTADLPPQTITLFVFPTGLNLTATQPANPEPANSATDVSVTPTLGWSASQNASFYHIYLGTSASAVSSANTASPEYRGATAATSFKPGQLAQLTTWYWRVDAQASGGVTTGSVWSFTTAAAPLGTVTLAASDGFGASSFASALNWNNGQAPNSANNYFTGTYQLRTPAGATGTTTFAGYSLTIDGGGKLLTKGANNSTLHFPSLILAGGTIGNGDDNVTAIISGDLTISGNSTIDADKSTRAFLLPASISGSQGLAISSSSAAGGVVRISNDNPGYSGNCTINSGATLEVGNGGSTGGLGSGNLANNGQLVFNRSGSLTITGSISGSGPLTSSANLALTLAGGNTYTGPTTINSGSLVLAGTLGNTAVTIASGATLAGSGSIAGNTAVNGALAPAGSGIGALSFGGSLTLSGAASLDLDTSHPARHDSVSVTGSLVAGGSLTIINSGPPLVSGDSFALFNKGYSGSFSSISLPALSGGLLWQNNLAVDGTIGVVMPAPAPPSNLAATAISSSQINLSWSDNSSDETGFKIERKTGAGGTYSQIAVAAANATTFSNTGLTAGTQYFYRIRATHSGGDSAYSGEASATTSQPAGGTTTTYNFAGVTQASTNHKVYACDVDQFPFGGSSANRNTFVQATNTQYAAISANNTSEWSTADPGSSDEMFLWVEMTVAEAAAAISRIDLTFNGNTAGSGPTDHLIYVLKSGANWTQDSSWVQLGSAQSIPSGVDTTVTRSITANIADYLDSTGKIIWGVYETRSSERLRINYLELAVTTAPGLPAPWQTQDIGTVGAVGGASYDSGLWTVTGSGADIWNNVDAFRFVHQTSTGDCSVVARVDSVENTNVWAKAGVMIRESTSADAINAGVFVTPANGVTFQWRSATGGTSLNSATAGLTAPCWVRITRTSGSFEGHYSADGINWTQLGTPQALTMSSAATIGLAVTSHNDGVPCTATMSNVTAAP